MAALLYQASFDLLMEHPGEGIDTDQIVECLAQHGHGRDGAPNRLSVAGSFTPVYGLVNGHGGNYVLSNVTQEANVTSRSMALFPGREDWDRARQDASCIGSTGQDMHAGELEVSLLLHADPQLVGLTRSARDHSAYPRPYLAIGGIGEYTKNGVIGLPSHGTATKGKAVLDSLSGSFASHLDVLNSTRSAAAFSN